MEKKSGEDIKFYKMIEERKKIILLVGYGHSGSTLMDIIFDCSSEVVGVGEFFQLKNSLKFDLYCSCLKRVEDCQFWKKIIRGEEVLSLKIGRRLIDFLFNRNNWKKWVKGREEKVDEEEYIRWHEDYYKRILDQSGGKVIFDSSKDVDRAELLLKNKEFETIIIHLVRDGRGAALSFFKVNPKKSILYYMFRWVVENLKVEIVKWRNREVKNIFINYKNFSERPKEVLKEVFDELGLVFKPDFIDNFSQKEHYQVGGNLNLRKRVFRENKVEIKRDLRWKEELSALNKLAFIVLFGWLNLYYYLRSRCEVGTLKFLDKLKFIKIWR